MLQLFFIDLSLDTVTTERTTEAIFSNGVRRLRNENFSVL